MLKKVIYIVLITLIGALHIRNYQRHYSQAQQILFNSSFPLKAAVESIEHTPNHQFPYRIVVRIYADQEIAMPLHRCCIAFHVQRLNRLQIGDVITLNPSLYQPIKNANCAWYYVRSGILTVVFSNAIAYTLISKPRYHSGRWINEKRNRLWCSFKKSLSPRTFLLFSQIFGGKNDISYSDSLTIKQYFKNWGLSHFLARSGAHLVFFMWLWILLFRLLPLGFGIKNFLLIMLITIYTIFTWLSLSFIRALCMAYITYSAKSCNKEPVSLHTLNLVTMGVLLCNPLHLFFLDFQLSFGFSYALIWFAQLNRKNCTKRQALEVF